MAHVIQPNALPVKKQATQTATACMWGICTWPLGVWAIMNDMVFLLLVFNAPTWRNAMQVGGVGSDFLVLSGFIPELNVVLGGGLPLLGMCQMTALGRPSRF